MSQTELSPPPAAADAPLDPTAARRMVVRKLSDLVVLPAGRLTAHERAIAADILLLAVEGCDAEERRLVAERLYRFGETTPALLRRLLLDDFDVAEPILTGASVLSDGLLAEIARQGTEEHRRAIAEREDITSAVADILIEFSETPVIEALLLNEMLHLSPSGVDSLVARSRYVERIRQLLLKRDELEPSHAFAMFWWSEPPLRRAILQRFSVDRRILQEALQDVFVMPGVNGGSDPIVSDVLSLIDRRRRPRIREGKAASPEAIRKTMDAARRKPDAELLQILAQLVGATRSTAVRVIEDRSGEALAVMAKALGVTREGFRDLLAAGGGDVVDDAEDGDVTMPRFTGDEAEYVLSVFDGLSHGFAQTVFRYWDWRGNPRLERLAGVRAGGASAEDPLEGGDA